MSPIVITDLAVQEGSFHLLTTAHPGRSSRAGLGPSCVPWAPRSSLGLSPGSQDYLPVTSRGRSSRPVRSHFREFSTVALPPPAPRLRPRVHALSDSASRCDSNLGRSQSSAQTASFGSALPPGPDITANSTQRQRHRFAGCRHSYRTERRGGCVVA